jgi:Domain of unknown function (DUF4190)/zinc-ribbon domain
VPETYCTACGSEVQPGQSFCGSCGHPVDGSVPGSMAAVSRSASVTSGKATASLVLGIAGFLVFPVVCSILAIVLGAQAKREIAADPRLSGEGMATAGLVLGWVGLAFVAVALLLVFGLAASHS